MPTENLSTILAPELLHILQHSLGVDEYGQGRQYRNHYVAGGNDVALCHELASMGYMKERAATALSGGDPWFNVTPAGIDAVALFSPAAPPPPKRTKYDKFLRDDSGLDFHEWLGINKPEFEHRGDWRNREYRMVRWGGWYSYRDVEGEWAPTKKAAKASYKAALRAHQAAEKAERARWAA